MIKFQPVRPPSQPKTLQLFDFKGFMAGGLVGGLEISMVG